MITNEAVLLGILMGMLAIIFYTYHSDNKYIKSFYKYCPALLLCYFLPSLLTSTGVVGHEDGNPGDKLYYMASRFLLPTSLVLLTLSIDFKRIIALGPKALIMFLTGTAGIVIGGPLAILLVGLFAPEWVGGDGANAVWKGMTTVAGSWIGGGANQAAMKELFGVGDAIFSSMVAVDVIVANVWMAVLLFMAGRSSQLDKKVGADVSAIEDLKTTVETFQKKHARIPNVNDLVLLLGVGFSVTALGHVLADWLAPMMGELSPKLAEYGLTSKFFWLILITTSVGISLSFTKAKQLEGIGASKIGSVFIYVLVTTIGLHMDIRAIAERPELFVVGSIWMIFHAGLILAVAKFIKAPTFFMAVGSQANVGGAASAPVVASAFHPSLAPVGVLLAVLGYGVGTFGAYLCGQIMRVIAQG